MQHQECDQLLLRMLILAVAMALSGCPTMTTWDARTDVPFGGDLKKQSDGRCFLTYVGPVRSDYKQVLTLWSNYALGTCALDAYQTSDLVVEMKSGDRTVRRGLKRVPGPPGSLACVAGYMLDEALVAGVTSEEHFLYTTIQGEFSCLKEGKS